MTQGFEANHSGKFLEGILRRELLSRGWICRAYEQDAGTLDIFSPRVVITNFPYRSLYGCQSRSEFLITDHSRKIRVECKWQEVGGSNDEKFPYLLRNAVECMPENEILIVHGGNGFRKKAIDWLEKEAKRISHKTIHVVNINDFTRWVRRELIEGRLQAAE